MFQQVKRGGYFGRIVGSPPGLPGGGITGVLPVSGAGACISGSTPGGGHNTPSERASLSPSGSARWPGVVPSGTAVPEFGFGCMGAQLAARSGGGGGPGAARRGGISAAAGGGRSGPRVGGGGGPFGGGGGWGWGVLAPPPHRPPPSLHMRSEKRVS